MEEKEEKEEEEEGHIVTMMKRGEEGKLLCVCKKVYIFLEF